MVFSSWIIPICTMVKFCPVVNILEPTSCCWSLCSSFSSNFYKNRYFTISVVVWSSLDVDKEQELVQMDFHSEIEFTVKNTYITISWQISYWLTCPPTKHDNLLHVSFGLNLTSGLFVQLDVLDGGAAPSRAPYPYRKTKETQWYCSWARKMTTTTESRKILDIHVLVNWHLSKRSSHQYHVIISRA